MKRRSKTSPAPTARYGNAASPYMKKRKSATRYGHFDGLHPEFYRSVSADPAGHPYRVQSGVIAKIIRDQERAAGAQ
jgi:hypothetical protein